MGKPMTPTLRVANMMNTLVRGRMGGTEVYADELVSRLGSPSDGILSIDVMSAGQAALNSSRTTVYLPSLRQGTGGFARLGNLLFNVLRANHLRSIIGPVDIAFYPFSAVTPGLRPTIGLVTTIHDLQHRELPQLFSRGQKIYRWLTYERPARKATAIVVVSDFTKQSVVKLLRINPDRVHRIYPGIDHSFFFPIAEKKSSDTPRFIYYPARGLAHKNHHTLFLAMEIVRETHPDLNLVLTGADQGLLGPLPRFVNHEGHVSRERVRDLMWSAEALVFPSLFEGFGFPPIEAMAAGCPVVSSPAGSLSEVCADAAELVDPMSPESIAAGIMRILNNRPAYIERGLKNAARFTWEKSAAQHVDLFHQIAK
jgi:glycosyltransferase involved in cell wall biosynthesis